MPDLPWDLATLTGGIFRNLDKDRVLTQNAGVETLHVDCVVVGAGVIGLAVARALALRGREVVVLESEPLIGTGISSRNSGVIHAGIYYPKDSLRAKLCVRGKSMLYAFCACNGVSHERIEKLIVATEVEQVDGLHALAKRATQNGVDDLEYLDAGAVRALEPAVACAAALRSPSTGIIDVHEYLLALQGDLESHGGIVATSSPFRGAAADTDSLIVDVGGSAQVRLGCRLLVNCAGLQAQAVADAIPGLTPDTVPRRYLAKGNYFHLSGRAPFQRLIYPLPSGAWLGVHVGFDLAGRCKFGPDMHWVEHEDYAVDQDQTEAFYASIRRYWPELPDGALQPDFTGIRPKLYGAGEAPRDFMIQMPTDHGVAGLINLFGIESPGLTSSLAIGEYVADVARR